MKQERSRNLTAEDKNTILHYALEAMFVKLIGEPIRIHEWQDKQASKLGDDVYRALVPKELERKLNALPDGVVPVTTALSCKRGEVEGSTEQDEQCTRWYNFTLTSQRRLPFNVYSERVTLKNDNPVFGKLRAIEKQAREYERTVRQLEHETRQVLSGIRTVRTLLERWPQVVKIEGIPPEILDDTPRSALIVLPSTVNSMLGLK